MQYINIKDIIVTITALLATNLLRKSISTLQSVAADRAHCFHLSRSVSAVSQRQLLGYLVSQQLH